MSILDQLSLESALDQASPVPDMPTASIHGAVLDAFPTRAPFIHNWSARIGAVAATVILGFGGFVAVQSYQANQKALTADADAFAEALLSESF